MKNGFGGIVLLSMGLVLPTAYAQPDVSTLGPGWECPLALSSFNGPGTIIEITSKNGPLEVVDLSHLITIKRKPAIIASFTDTREIKTGIIASFLEKLIPGVKAKLGAQAGAKRANSISYDRVTEERTDFAAEDKALQWVRKNPKAFKNRTQGSRYYLVRYAYLAGHINYDLSSEMTTAVGGEAAFNGLGNVSVSLINVDGSTHLRLDQTMDPPLRVCIKTREIGVVGAGSGGEARFGLLPGDGKLPTDLAF